MTGPIQMSPIFVPMAKEELSIPEREAQLLRDTEIGQSARQYVEMEKWAEQQIKNWLPNVDEHHLSGSKESTYLKKLGHRALTKGDLLNLVLTFGDEQHKQRITSFKQAQTDLSNRLDKMSNLGLVLKQAGINYNTYYLRKSEPERWKAEEVIAVMTVLQRLKL